jgi:hypothetical protein
VLVDSNDAEKLRYLMVSKNLVSYLVNRHLATTLGALESNKSKGHNYSFLKDEGHFGNLW